jgi:hypothetical protein
VVSGEYSNISFIHEVADSRTSPPRFSPRRPFPRSK